MKSGLMPFIQKKLTQLILPCITWSLILLILSSAHQVSDYKLQNVPLKYIETFHLNFWFLKSAFICYLIVYIGKKLIRNEFLFYLLSIAVVEMTMDFYHMHTMYPSFILGIMLKKYQEKWYGKPEITVSMLSIFAFLLIFWDELLFNSTLALFGNYYYDYIFNSLYKLFIGLAGAFAMISLFSCLFHKITKQYTLNLCKIGQYTLGIYILQTIIVEKGLSVIISMDKVDNIYYTFILTPVISLLTITICIFIIKLISKNKKLNLICFGKV